MPEFKVVSAFAPAGDQPGAIAGLAEGVTRGDRFQTLLGITGSGKSATIAWTIEAVQRPTLILAPNKSLAAQLTQEMREFFPENRVEYFVSYYDYYQPEAYIASSDTYIEKDSSINDEIDRLRHSATAALLTRRDTIVVASVSCIYGMGDPAEYRGQLLELHTGVDYDMRSILRRLVDLQVEDIERAVRDGHKTIALNELADLNRQLKAFAAERGLKIVSGGTDSHVMLVDLRPKKATGIAAEKVLDRSGITVNKNSIPGDPEKYTITSGVRLGSPAGTTRGFGVAEFRQVGHLIADVLDGIAKNGPEGDAQVEAQVRGKVRDLCARFPIYRD